MLNLAKKLKIFLLVPNFDSEKKSIMNVRKRQPLSMAIIAAALRSKGYEIKFLDANALGLPVTEILNSIDKFRPAVLICTTTPVDRWECPNSHIENILKLISRADAKYKIVVGSHGTTMPEWLLENCRTDFIVRGEPEMAVQELIEALENNRSISAIKGLSYRRGREIISNPIARIMDLDVLPFPAYDLLPMEKYASNDFKQPFTIVLTSRGCPYNCSFCLKAMASGPYITRSVAKVIEEIEYLIKNFQIKSIYFQDWEFFIDGRRVEDICHAILDKQLKFAWGANARATDIIRQRELLPLFKKAGCMEINLGMESASDRVLKKINKQITKQDLEQAVNILKANGIRGNYYMLLNAPGENRETIRETAEFIFRNKLRVRPFLPPLPYPGTKIFEQLKEKFPGRKIDWSNIERFAGLTDTALRPKMALAYLRHYKKVLAYGRWYFLKPLFWRDLFFSALKVKKPAGK